MVKQSMDLLDYYASVVWTETWTFCGKPCASWWTASWAPRFPPRSAPSTANAARSESPTATAVKGGGKTYHWGVEVQGEYPVKCSA